jgi:hypothetical protein
MENRSHSPTAYLHQSQAIQELLSRLARPVVATTLDSLEVNDGKIPWLLIKAIFSYLTL